MRQTHRATAISRSTDFRPVLLGLAAGAVLILSTALSAKAQGTTISHGYSNFGALKYPADMAYLDYVNPDAPKGGEISISAQGTFDSFNLYARKGVPAAQSTIASESLLTATADDPYGTYCMLCETMEYPDDLKWVIFNLRKDVTFADGTPMTAEDVAFSYNLFVTQGIAEYRAIVSGVVENVEVLGPYQIRFTFNDNVPKRERLSFPGGTPVFSKAWFEETGARLDESSDQLFMSTGAYVLDEYEINRRVVYKRNPDYWGADHPMQIGRNNFDRIRIEYFADGTAAFEGFTAGVYTMRIENSSLLWATSYDFPGVQKGNVIKAEFPDGSVGTAQSFVFNLDRPNWQDPRVREAVGMMFNFEWSNETLFYGLYTRVDSFWPGTDLAATGVPTQEEIALLQPLVDEGLMPASVLTDEAQVPPVLDGDRNRPDRRSFRAASALLDEAGWEIGDDGKRRNAAGEVLTLDILSVSPLFDRIINPYVENLTRLGIEAKLDRVDNAQYVERRRSGDFDLVNHGFSMGFEPGIGLEQWFASKTADDSSRNLMRLRNPAVDRLLPKVVEATTLDELRTSVHALDRVLRYIGFTVPQWYKDVHTVAYYDMFGRPEALPPLDPGLLDIWWYDAEKHEALKAAGALR
ncbi:extracellular solute-binding protein [Aliiroseovarius sp.]|uniref:extracellular solute-binding protein n=1 Tax=Aliiroseovarius sp. TaxID=1872442 RepID=UPI0026181082|nr:extracellular solute-binding protein [Aliiroseovarius sp.]